MLRADNMTTGQGMDRGYVMNSIDDSIIKVDLPFEEYDKAIDDGRFGITINNKKLKAKLLMITTRAARNYKDFSDSDKRFRFSVFCFNNQCCVSVPFEDYDGILLEASGDWSTIDRYYVRKTMDGWFLHVDHDVEPEMTVTTRGRVEKPCTVIFPEDNYIRLSRMNVVELLELPVRNVSLFLGWHEILSLPLLELGNGEDFDMIEEPEVTVDFIERLNHRLLSTGKSCIR